MGKPDFKDCGKKPKIPESAFGTSSFDEAQKRNTIQRRKYYKCLEENTTIKEKSKAIKYYYARTPNNKQPNIPPREPNHAIYEVNLSFGPLGDVMESALSNEQKKIKGQLQQWTEIIAEKSYTYYYLPGKESNLYYSVRSILKSPQAAEGFASSPWLSPDSLMTSPQDWHEVTGIKITKAQYEYMFSHCEGTVFGCHLADGTPDLSAEQKAYIKTTTWDIDNDIEAREAYAEESDKYRVDKQ